VDPSLSEETFHAYCFGCPLHPVLLLWVLLDNDDPGRRSAEEGRSPGEVDPRRKESRGTSPGVFGQEESEVGRAGPDHPRVQGAGGTGRRGERCLPAQLSDTVQGEPRPGPANGRGEYRYQESRIHPPRMIENPRGRR